MTQQEGKPRTQNIPGWVIDDNLVSPSHRENFSDHSPVPLDKHKAPWGPSRIAWSTNGYQLRIQLLGRK